MSRHAGFEKSGRWVAALLLSTIQACAGSPEIEHVLVENAMPAPQGAVPSEPRRTQQGDVMLIRFLFNPELDTETRVRPDGAITLPLIGELTAAGQTPAELRGDISRRYRDFVERTGYGALLKEGDDVELRWVANPELNFKAGIRSDGRISLPLVGEVPAAGLPPGELREDLRRRYGAFIREPDFALIPGPRAARKVYAEEAFLALTLIRRADDIVFVGGEVGKPGAVAIRGHLTALQAITAAGGVTVHGDLSKVVILRRGQYEQGEWIRTNLEAPLAGEHVSNDLAVRPGDVMLVPKSGIAKVNLWVHQYVTDALPFLTNAYITVIPYQRQLGAPVPQSQQPGAPAGPPPATSSPGGAFP
jgi:protein involved in polysaccharide export with SLBB domain